MNHKLYLIFKWIVPGCTKIIARFGPKSLRKQVVQEARNKVDAVSYAYRRRELPDLQHGVYDGGEHVRACYRLDPFEALWAVEGFGHQYADAINEAEYDTQKLLNREERLTWPKESMAMLHAGMGLAFAKKCFRFGLWNQPDDQTLLGAVERCLRWCRVNAHSDYWGAAVESIGLYIRFPLETALLGRIAGCISTIDKEAVPYFWHGVGRAMYFAPVYFLHGMDPVMRVVKQSGLDDIERQNILSGLAWAITLVNMNDPQVVVEKWRHYGSHLTRDGGFSNGVLSALLVRKLVTPTYQGIQPFLSAVAPENCGKDDGFARRWFEQIVEPAKILFSTNDVRSYLHEGKVGALFRDRGLELHR